MKTNKINLQWVNYTPSILSVLLHSELLLNLTLNPYLIQPCGCLRFKNLKVNELKCSFELHSTYKVLPVKRLIDRTSYFIQLSKFISIILLLFEMRIQYG